MEEIKKVKYHNVMKNIVCPDTIEESIQNLSSLLKQNGEFKYSETKGEVRSGYRYDFLNESGSYITNDTVGIYYIYDGSGNIQYIGEGEIRDRLRKHFKGLTIFKRNANFKKKRNDYRVKILLIEDLEGKKHGLRAIEQHSYMLLKNKNKEIMEYDK